ncbi:MAG: hypothetical protein IRY96_04780, partial [Burkholderiales bacterium]|nr:hypothetical protein [Burkholderiales bacterium]
MAGQINALIPLKVQAPDFAGSLSSGVDIGNALLMAPIERKLKEAQAKYYSENAGSNSVYGTPIFGTDEAGNTVLGAFDKRGMFHRIDTGGVTPTPGVRFLDLGTSVQGVNIKSGQPVGGPIPKDVSGRAAQEKIGEATGTAQTTLPTVADNVGIALGYIDQLKNEAKDTYGLGDNPVSSMFANVARNVPGTESFGFQQKVNQLKGTAFLQAYNTLRGSGQI